MRFLILFTFLISNVLADDLPKIKNIVIHKDLKTYDNVIFLDQNDQKINIKDFNGNLILLNFSNGIRIAFVRKKKKNEYQ